MMLDKLLASAYAASVTVFGIVAGRHALDQITAVAHVWAGHIETYIKWGN